MAMKEPDEMVLPGTPQSESVEGAQQPGATVIGASDPLPNPKSAAVAPSSPRQIQVTSASGNVEVLANPKPRQFVREHHKPKHKNKHDEDLVACATKKMLVHNDSNQTTGLIASAKQEEPDPILEAFITQKLAEWDVDGSGCFDRDEILAMMEDWHDMKNERRRLKLNVTFGTLGSTAAIILLVAAIFTALMISQDGSPSVGSGGSFQARGNNGRTDMVVTEQMRADTGLENILAFDDEITDSWAISDQQLREVDVINFEHGDATHHFEVAHVMRTDSGPQGETDKVEFLTTGGHQIRYWETVGSLEVRWFGTDLWEVIDPAGDRTAPGFDPASFRAPGPIGNGVASNEFGAANASDDDNSSDGVAGSNPSGGPQSRRLDLEELLNVAVGRDPPVMGLAPPSVAYDPHGALDPPRGRRMKGSRTGRYVGPMMAGGAAGGYAGSRRSGGGADDDCRRINATHYYCDAAGGLQGLAVMVWMCIFCHLGPAVSLEGRAS